MNANPERPRRPVTWREALDRLEEHADRAERMLQGHRTAEDAPWQPPTDLGPIPDEFLPRARVLLERQQRLMAAIPGILSDTRQQQRVADRVSDATTTRSVPVYLDVTA
ncbi:MAG: hypothetical protein NTX33_12580 [Propionibacteriales bacterium]|nr:hypothetical protein [Propionibacteriales bacterium]